MRDRSGTERENMNGVRVRGMVSLWVCNKRGHMSFDRFISSIENSLEFNFQFVENFPDTHKYVWMCSLCIVVLMYWVALTMKAFTRFNFVMPLLCSALLYSINHHRYYFPISLSHFIPIYSPSLFYFLITLTHKSWIFDENRSPIK